MNLAGKVPVQSWYLPALGSEGWVGMEDGEMFQGGAGRGKMNGWEEVQRLLLT